MDVLSDILKIIRLKSSVYFRSDFSAPWGMEIAKGPFAQFHIVVRGRCLLEMEGRSIDLYKGDIVLFPFGDTHRIMDEMGSQCVSGKEVVASISRNAPAFAGDNIATTLICGHFEFERDSGHPFIQSLPSFIHITDTGQGELSWTEMVVNAIIQETDSGKPGSKVIANRLAEVLFIHALRIYMNKGSLPNRFFTALGDKHINEALQMIHLKPGFSWTLDLMAKKAGISRTLFANRFKLLVGKTPNAYLTNWRMLKARERLLESNEPVQVIAERVGYLSESAFNRVFKKKFDKTPGAFRREALRPKLGE